MIKSIFIFIDRVKNKVLKKYREYIFFCRTGQQVNLVKDITLINTNLKIGKNVIIYPDVMFFGDGPIEIGDSVSIGNGTIIYASKMGGGVSIGSYTNIAAQCYIIDMDHGIQGGELIRNQANKISKIRIGRDVWIGSNVTILKGSIIENSAVIGAKGLVKGFIPENAVAVGAPAKIIKYRN